LKILHVISSANPSSGGPLEGVRQRGIHLQQDGHTVEIVTSDDPKESFVKEFPLPVHALGPSSSGYGYNGKLVPWLKENASRFDAVIVNGLWQYHSFGAWRALRNARVPYFVFTHGMLDPWFKRTYPLKHLKKWIYWPLAEYRVLRDAQAVLFTSEEERLLARKSFWLYRANEHVIAYGTTPPPNDAAQLRERFLAANPELRGRRVLLFLSRIHVKKGCDLLIRALAGFAATQPALHLVVAGPDQTGWVQALQQLAHRLGVSDRVTWPGMLRGDMKWGAFYAAEAFILPSHQENFGIAVAEALGCGRAVLISDKVNIWREVQSHGAGIVAPDTEEGTLKLLREWLSLTSDQRSTMGRNARALFEERFTVDAMAAGLLDVVGGRSVQVAAYSGW
jgi:glycosyltransferase involved in cell wall biosynthesis